LIDHKGVLKVLNGGIRIQNIRESIEACAAYYGEAADEVRQYLIEGQKRALDPPNRGPLRFNDKGKAHPDILEAYST
jgi:hypothetical protein